MKSVRNIENIDLTPSSEDNLELCNYGLEFVHPALMSVQMFAYEYLLPT